MRQRGWRRNLMVIEDDGVNALPFEPLDGVHGGGTAIDCQQKRGRKLGQAILHAGLAEAVAFFHAMREISVHFPSERSEKLRKQRRGGDAIDVVVPEDHNRFTALASKAQSIGRSLHVRKQKGISKALEARLKEARDGLRFAEATVQQTLCEQRRNFQRLGQKPGQRGLGRSDGPAVFHHANQPRKSSIAFFTASKITKMLSAR